MSTYTPIATQTATTSISSITFSNIPQKYTDLVLISNAKSATTNGAALLLEYNSDTGSNYSSTFFYGAIASGRAQSPIGCFAGRCGTQFSSGITHIQNYSNTTTYKTEVSRGDDESSVAIAYVGTWRNTSAITSIKIKTEEGVNFATGSTFSLYGIQSGAPKAFGGDTVTTDGTYWYHTFTSSGVFTPTKNLTADYLVVAGGGGGGGAEINQGGGGGGAGGLRSTVTATGGGGSLESALSLTAGTSYTVTVGAGGAGGTGGGGTGSGTNGSAGNDSVFSTITSNKGGGGGTVDTSAPTGTFGSGGGAGSGGSNTNGAGGTSGQGYAGGNNQHPSGNFYGAGGGGGAGAVGGAGGDSNVRTGGNGVATSITGTSITYGGGGGGGAHVSTQASAAGGTGGGGASAAYGTTNSGVAGTANTGGGGGGGNYGGAGGSGIVIVRYAV